MTNNLDSFDVPSLTSGPLMVGGPERARRVRASRFAYTSVDWVHACVQAIISGIQRMPFELLTEDGDLRGDADEWVRLMRRPNPVQHGRQFWAATAGFMELEGEAFWLVETKRDVQNEGMNLRPYNRGTGEVPFRIWAYSKRYFHPKYKKDSKIVDYWEFGTASSTRRLKVPPESVVQLRTWNPEDMSRGIGKTDVLAGTLSVETSAQRHQEETLRNDAKPSGVITSPHLVDPDTMQRMEQSWEENMTGEGKAGKTAFLSDGAKYQRITLASREMEMLDRERFTMKRILAVFRVPQSKIGMVEDSTFSNADKADETFYEDNLIPKTAEWCEAFMELTGVSCRFNSQGLPYKIERLKQTSEALVPLVGLGYTPDQLNNTFGLGLPDIGPQQPTGTEETEPVQASFVRGPRRMAKIKKAQRDEEHELIEREVMDVHEPKFKRAYVRWVRGYYAELMARFDDAAAPLKSYRKAEGFKYEDLRFEDEKFVELYRESMHPLFLDVTKSGLESVASELQSSSMMLSDPRVTEFVRQKEVKALQVTESVRQDTRRVLERAFREGRTVEETRQVLQRLEGFETGVRSLRVARTETSQSANGSRNLGFVAEGVTRKSWSSALDNNVRTDHSLFQAMGDQPIEFDYMKRAVEVTGGGPLLYPGDLTAPAGQVVSCRCTHHAED